MQRKILPTICQFSPKMRTLVMVLGCLSWWSVSSAEQPQTMQTAAAVTPVTATASAQPLSDGIYRIGAGIADITGEAAESNMFGYADAHQITTGIQQRQNARAFLIGDGHKEILMVVLDTGAVMQGMQQAVLAELKKKYGNRFTEDNVMLTATHTHSTPGGTSYYALYALTTRGFQKPTFDAAIYGTLRAIDKAVNNAAPGRLNFGINYLYNAGVQRSMTAYVNDPEAKNNPKGIDPLMQVLRFNQHGKDVAAISWFAIHPTSLTSHNTLVSGDNKGYASWYWEKQQGMDYVKGKGFIAAFANSNPGDITPNTRLKPGKGPTDDQWQNAQIMGQRQADSAMQTDTALLQVSGGVDYRMTYVDMSRQQVDAQYTVDGKPHRTCPATYKTTFAAGSMEDGGGGLSFVQEGHNNTLLKTLGYVLFAPSADLVKCQETDQIAIAMGTTKPVPMSPDVLPLQLFRVGNIAIISLPSEFTVTAGKRLRQVVAKRLNLPIEHVIFTGYANAYAGYNVTPEEYRRLDYEGASTHFGPHTLEAWQENLDKVATAMKNGQAVAKPIHPRDLSKNTTSLVLGVVYDTAPMGKHFGDVAVQPAQHYQRGKTASATFWSAHPKSTLAYELAQYRAGKRDEEPYTMAIQYKDGDTWKTVATDYDWNTVNRWKRVMVSQSQAILTWDIPQDAPAGEYRFYHRGAYKQMFSGKYMPFEGYSRSFMVD